MGAVEAIKFLIDDHGDKGSGFREAFAKDEPYRSLLQRNGKTLDEVLELFKWDDDDKEWVSEYTSPDKRKIDNLTKYRRRVDFAVTGWREINEDFGRGDVSCLRDIRTPLVTSRSPMRIARDEFEMKEGG